MSVDRCDLDREKMVSWLGLPADARDVSSAAIYPSQVEHLLALALYELPLSVTRGVEGPQTVIPSIGAPKTSRTVTPSFDKFRMSVCRLL